MEQRKIDGVGDVAEPSKTSSVRRYLRAFSFCEPIGAE